MPLLMSQKEAGCVDVLLGLVQQLTQQALEQAEAQRRRDELDASRRRQDEECQRRRDELEAARRLRDEERWDNELQLLRQSMDVRLEEVMRRSVPSSGRHSVRAEFAEDSCGVPRAGGRAPSQGPTANVSEDVLRLMKLRPVDVTTSSWQYVLRPTRLRRAVVVRKSRK